MIFFAVSGYCLSNIRQGFLGWYKKRIIRIYVPAIVITLVYVLLKYYNGSDIIRCFIYPTQYHFVASIMILYIPFYFIAKSDKLKKYILHIMMAIFVVYLFVYLFVYDKSYYHIDAVREPFIRFLFMESMLLGLWFRENDEKYRDNCSNFAIVCLAICFILYFISKLFFSKNADYAMYQIINQIFVFGLLYFVLRVFAGFDNKLEHMPKLIKKIVEFLSNITLEIYLVQYAIIDYIRPAGRFPINWILVTASIIIAAYSLHFVCKYIIKYVNQSPEKICTLFRREKI